MECCHSHWSAPQVPIFDPVHYLDWTVVYHWVYRAKGLMAGQQANTVKWRPGWSTGKDLVVNRNIWLSVWFIPLLLGSWVVSCMVKILAYCMEGPRLNLEPGSITG